MAGFLDSKERIIDMVLTNEGKRLLSQGKLSFRYFCLFDDEVNYSPFISGSASFTPEALSSSIDYQIEATPIREATSGYRGYGVSGSDTTNVFRPLFTVPQGTRILPRMTALNAPTGTLQVDTKQRKLQDEFVRYDQKGERIDSLGPYDRGVERYDTSTFTIDFVVNDMSPSVSSRQGFLLKTYLSAADGYHEVPVRRDSRNDIVYTPTLKVERK